MYEKWLRLDSSSPPDVRKTVVQSLRQVYSAWTNWYLAHQQYDQSSAGRGECSTLWVDPNDGSG